MQSVPYSNFFNHNLFALRVFVSAPDAILWLNIISRTNKQMNDDTNEYGEWKMAREYKWK